jgi:hypothetical protein
MPTEAPAPDEHQKAISLRQSIRDTWKIVLNGRRGLLATALVSYGLVLLAYKLVSLPMMQHYGSFLFPGRGVDFVAILLSLAGISYAMQQDYASKNQDIALREHGRLLKNDVSELARITKVLNDVVQSLPTRVMAQFPIHVPQIAEFTKESSGLTMLSDCLDYGSFYCRRAPS